MEIIIWFAILFVSLTVLVKASDYFTDYSERLGLSFGLSAFIIGATIMSIGTSMPEFVTALLATLDPDPALKSFAIDDIIGSNIANALLLIGIASLVAKGGKGLSIKKELIDVDLPFLIMASGIFVVFALDGDITFKEGITFLVFFALFMVYTFSERETLEAADLTKKTIGEIEAMSGPIPLRRRVFNVLPGFIRHIVKKGNGKSKLFFMIALSCGFIFIGGKGTVTSVLNITELLGWSTSVLTILIVALGTSLPEIFVAGMSAYKGNHAGAVGTAFGSNIFNILFALGIPSLFATLTVSEKMAGIGMVFLIFSVISVAFVTIDDQVRKWEGGALILIYFGFVGKILGVI